MELSRRRFAQLAGTAALAGPPLAAQQSPLTAQQAIDRIQKNTSAPWRSETSDGIKAGDPATPITGIVTTALATMDVLTRAAKEKANLIITSEPTFFGQKDAAIADDPVYSAKKDFLEKNRMVVWRFSENWRTRESDPMLTGLAATLGWTGQGVHRDAARFEMPAMTLAALTDHLAKRLKARAGIRVVGDPQTPIHSIILLPGTTPLAATMKALPTCDLVIAGEVREWESVEYAQDTVASGQKKGFITIGRVLSEDPGMEVCAQWLTKLVPEVPARWLPAGDPYWRPA
jgi:putative NIF3 family GTP cyclohydrolase 1 type 2